MPNIENTAGAAMPRTIDERIAAIEARLPQRNIAGTSITRVMHEKQGVEWCLSLGAMGLPKTFFRGPTIDDVVTQGEQAVANMTGQRLKTDWDVLEEVLLAPYE